MFKLPDGSRERRQLRYMTMSIGEAYEAFIGEMGEEQKVGKSKFFSLRPPEVLHEREIPASMCVCQLHADMDELLKGLARNFPDDLPSTGRQLISTMMCSRENEACMLFECNVCKNNLRSKTSELVINQQ